MNYQPLIVQNEISISWYDAIVYARIDAIEVGAKYRDYDGDRARTLEAAIAEVIRLDTAACIKRGMPKPYLTSADVCATAGTKDEK